MCLSKKATIYQSFRAFLSQKTSLHMNAGLFLLSIVVVVKSNVLAVNRSSLCVSEEIKKSFFLLNWSLLTINSNVRLFLMCVVTFSSIICSHAQFVFNRLFISWQTRCLFCMFELINNNLLKNFVTMMHIQLNAKYIERNWNQLNTLWLLGTICWIESLQSDQNFYW